jgi:hypothetical protein
MWKGLEYVEAVLDVRFPTVRYRSSVGSARCTTRHALRLSHTPIVTSAGTRVEPWKLESVELRVESVCTSWWHGASIRLTGP